MSGTFPTGIISSEILRSQHVTLVSEAQSLKQQARAKETHKWLIDVETTILTQAQWQDLLGFLVSQRGRFDTFTYTLNSHTLQGTGSGTPLVNGASQTGRSLITDGWGNNETVLKRGDIFKLAGGNKVYMITANVTSDGTGNATLSIEPALVTSPANNAALTITSVSFTVALSENLSEISVQVSRLGSASLTFEERV